MKPEIYKIEYGSIGSIEYTILANGDIVFMGSLVDKKSRRQGIFTKLLMCLCRMFYDRTIYCAVKNVKIIESFTDNGFKLTKTPIPIWNAPKNCCLMVRQPDPALAPTMVLYSGAGNIGTPQPPTEKLEVKTGKIPDTIIYKSHANRSGITPR